MSEQTLMLKVEESSASAIQGLENLISVLGRVKDAITKGVATTKLTKGIDALNASIAKISEDKVRNLERLADSLERLKSVGSVKINISNRIKQALNLEPLEQAEDSGKAMTDSTRQISDAMDSVGKSGKTGGKGIRDFNSRIKEGINPAKGFAHRIANIFSSFVRIAKYRFIRYVLKQIKDGFKFGISNMREYSKAIGSDFAIAMDSANNATFKLKNSLGAALAPVLQMLIPILQRIVNWVIQAVNAFNQLFALLRGQSTWTRATDATADSMNAVKDAAKKAKKEVKDLLADFDELNIIQSKNKNVGKIDYGSMFEEVGVFDEQIQGLYNRIQPIIDYIKNAIRWIKENFSDILRIVFEILSAILLWNLSKAFQGWLASLFALASAAMIAKIVFDITTLFDKEYLKSGNIGWVIADVLTTALGAFLANKIVGSVISKGAGSVTASIVLTVSAVADVIALLGAKDVSALDTKSIVLAIKSAVKFGAGIAWVSKSMFGLATMKALGAGLGGAALWAGVVIGIKALKGAADTGEVTRETINASLISALSSSIGLGALVWAFGAPPATAALVAAGALLGGIAFFGVTLAALIHLKTEGDDIRWGNIELTKEQVETFAQRNMFTVDIPTTVNVISTRIDTANIKKSEVKTALVNALGTFNVIKLGVSKEQDYDQMKTDLDTLLETIDGYIEESKALGKLTLQFTPTLVGENEKDASSWFGNYTTGWDKVNEWAQKKGAEIADYLVKAEAGTITKEESKVLSAIMNQLSDVSNAIANAKITSSAFANMKFSIGDLTKASAVEVAKAFAVYKEELKSGYEKLVTEQYEAQNSLVAALFAIDPNSDEYKKALTDLEEMEKNLVSTVDKYVREASQQGADMILDLLTEKYANSLNSMKMGAFGNIANALKDSIINEDTAKIFKEDLKQFIHDATKIDNEFLNVLDTESWRLIPEEIQKKMVIALRDAIGSQNTEELFRLAGIDLSEQMKLLLTPNIDFTQPTVTDSGNVMGALAETNQDLQEAVEESQPTTIVQPTLEYREPIIIGDDAGTYEIPGYDVQWDDTDIKNLYQNLYGAIHAYKPEIDPRELFNKIIYPMIVEAAGENGISESDVKPLSDKLYYEWLKSLHNEDWKAGADYVTKDLQSAFKQATPPSIPTPDTSTLKSGIANAAKFVRDAVNSIRKSFAALNGLSFSFYGGAYGGGYKVNIPTVSLNANGGMIDTGEMFIARESGPELVGRIGRKSTVANNDQIIDGIASGVAAGQESQNSLLRQNNELLARLLNKKLVAEVRASGGLGRVNSQSERMYQMIGG